MKTPSQPARWYNPGQSVRFTTASTVVDEQGIAQLTDSPTLTLTLHSPDGSLIVDPAPMRISKGKYRSDQVIPMNAKPGVWVARWRSSGASPSQNTNEEKTFGVNQLDF